MTSKMAKRRDPTGLRRQRIQKLHQMLKGVGDVDLVRFTATCEYQMGLTRKRIREYLGTLETLGLVEVDDESGIVREVVKE